MFALKMKSRNECRCGGVDLENLKAITSKKGSCWYTNEVVLEGTCYHSHSLRRSSEFDHSRPP